MAATPQSPNVDNYFIGKGVLQFKPEGDVDWFYLGNCPSFVFAPTLENLEHFSSMEGVRSRDLTVILEKGGTVTMQLEELTPRNLGLFLLGDPDFSDPLAPSIEVFASNLKSGAVRFIATNDIGPKWTFEFNKVDFTPTSELGTISDEFGSLELTGELATIGGSFGTASLRGLAAVTVPVNVGLPEVIGSLVEGQELTAYEGVWDGDGIVFTYQWNSDGTPIGGATDSTFTLTATEVGTDISVDVIATNTHGNDTAVSPEQGPVVEAAS